jgi:signal transduction histidine kinase
MTASSVRARPTFERGADPLLVLPVATIAGLLVTWWALSVGVEKPRAAVDLAVSWSFAGAGILALERASLRRSGALMLTVAATWFLYDLQHAESELLWTVGWVFADVYAAVLVQLIVSFPEGRIWSPSARVLVVATYAATVGCAFLGALFEPDRRNLLLVTPDVERADAIGQVSATAGVVIVVALIALVISRLVRLRGLARRASAPLLLGALAAASFAVVSLAATALGDDEFRDRIESVDRFVTILIPLGFVAGLVRSHLRRSSASSLVVQLREPSGETLRGRLARTLGDPTLDVAYWSPDAGGYVDDQGLPVDVSETTDRAVTQVVAGDTPVAALLHDRALLEEPELVESVRATAALVLENERLAAEIRAQLAEVEASRTRILTATDEERRRLERDLHDGAQQRLVALSLKLALAQIGAEPAAAAALAGAQHDLESALAELREFARGVHPSILREDGLDAAVQTLARHAPIPVSVSAGTEGRLPDRVELAAYFFVSEALTNIAKHARASSASVSTLAHDGALTVIVADDGVGGATFGNGSGLAGLVDRLAALNGELDIESVPGLGTTLTARIPCAS